MRADARVETDAVNDGLSVEAFHLGVGVKLIEIAHAKGEVGVGKELHGLCLGRPHEQSVDVLLHRALLQKSRKDMGGAVKARVPCRSADYDAARVEIVVEGLALAEELRREYYVFRAVFSADTFGVSNRDGGLYHHNGMRVYLKNEFNDSLHGRGVEEVALAVIVGRRSYDDKLRVTVGRTSVKGCTEVQLLL